MLSEGRSSLQSPRQRQAAARELPTGTGAIVRSAAFCSEVIYLYCTISFKYRHRLGEDCKHIGQPPLFLFLFTSKAPSLGYTSGRHINQVLVSIR